MSARADAGKAADPPPIDQAKAPTLGTSIDAAKGAARSVQSIGVGLMS